MKEIPLAIVTDIVTEANGSLSIRVRCPYYRGVHKHGDSGDPTRREFGRRIAHCVAVVPDPAGYMIIQLDAPKEGTCSARRRSLRVCPTCSMRLEDPNDE